jgi:hypothetical protein
MLGIRARGERERARRARGQDLPGPRAGPAHQTVADTLGRGPGWRTRQSPTTFPDQAALAREGMLA